MCHVPAAALLDASSALERARYHATLSMSYVPSAKDEVSHALVVKAAALSRKATGRGARCARAGRRESATCTQERRWSASHARAAASSMAPTGASARSAVGGACTTRSLVRVSHVRRATTAACCAACGRDASSATATARTTLSVADGRLATPVVGRALFQAPSGHGATRAPVAACRTERDAKARERSRALAGLHASAAAAPARSAARTAPPKRVRAVSAAVTY